MIAYDCDGMKDDPWNTAADYATNRAAAFLAGEDFADKLADFIDWWDNCDDDTQKEILDYVTEPEPKSEPESQESKHCDEGYMNDTRFGPPED